MEIHQQIQYTLHLLIGLNDTYAQTKGQILLIDPLPPLAVYLTLFLKKNANRKLEIISPIRMRRLHLLRRVTKENLLISIAKSHDRFVLIAILLVTQKRSVTNYLGSHMVINSRIAITSTNRHANQVTTGHSDSEV